MDKPLPEYQTMMEIVVEITGTLKHVQIIRAELHSDHHHQNHNYGQFMGWMPLVSKH